MEERDKSKGALGETTIRICPVCGVVNPSGPSESCPHLQLVRFQGIDTSLESLLKRVATVRNQFTELVSELRAYVMQAARLGEAEVIATQRGRVSEVQALGGKPEPLSLTNPEPPKPKPTPTRKKKKAPAPASVDPRQLALIARDPPRGDA
jgi:hypothetical protein